MANAKTSGKLPPRFGVQTERGAAGERRVLWFGPNRIAFDDIEAIEGDETRERPIGGLVLGACIFLSVAMILAFGVLETGWRPRFLLGAFFLTCLGIAGISEITKLKPQRFFQIRIRTRSKGVLTFASADPDEVRAFQAALATTGSTI